MKTFSIKWKGSKKPKKQRKYAAKAPLHIKRKFLNAGLSKELREKHKRRSVEVRKGDTVKILIGKFKKKTGKISKIKTKRGKIYIEGIQRKKQDGSMVEIPFRAPNLQIIELDTNDKRRFMKTKGEAKTETTKKEEKAKVKKEKKKSNGEIKK
ncbi:MAG: 50S ribosomal protein L24 [archaeon]|nr:50S ribosomal protein L24 [archaeon]